MSTVLGIRTPYPAEMLTLGEFICLSCGVLICKMGRNARITRKEILGKSTWVVDAQQMPGGLEEGQVLGGCLWREVMHSTSTSNLSTSNMFIKI